MNRWKPNKPKDIYRLILEFHKTKNPVTRSVLRDIINNRSDVTREVIK